MILYRIGTKRGLLYRLFIWSFVLLYPTIASIYAFSPPLLGIASFILIEALEKKDIEHIFMVLVYLLNIDVNFSMPLFLSLLATLLIYTLVYPRLNVFLHCKICVAGLIVVIFNLLYLEMVLIYSYVFKELILEIDALLVAYFVFDLMMVLIV